MTEQHRQNEIAEDRPLNVAERELVEWLLDHGESDGVTFQSHLDELRVIRRCGCGCASIDFSVKGKDPPRGVGMDIVSDHFWRTSHGDLCGCSLFAKSQQLAGLEVWSIDGAEVPTELPSPGKLKPLSEINKERVKTRRILRLMFFLVLDQAKALRPSLE